MDGSDAINYRATRSTTHMRQSLVTNGLAINYNPGGNIYAVRLLCIFPNHYALNELMREN